MIARSTRAPADGLTRMRGMAVGVVDVGSNTVRLLIAAPSTSGIERVREERAYVGLGAEILEHGIVRPERIEHAAETVRRFARLARKAGVVHLEVFVTAPGRQAANADEMVVIERQILEPPQSHRGAHRLSFRDNRRLDRRQVAHLIVRQIERDQIGCKSDSVQVGDIQIPEV